MDDYYNIALRRNEVDAKYTKGIIYMIDVDGEHYVGSTIKDINTRFKQHIHDTLKRNRPQSKLYDLIKIRGGWEDVNIYLLEHYPCNNKFLLQVRETRWMNVLQSTLNIKHYYHYFNQYYWDNKFKIAEYKKEYARKNIEKEAQRKKEWYEKNKSRLSIQKKTNYHEVKHIINKLKRDAYIPKPKPSEESIRQKRDATIQKRKNKAKERVECVNCGKNLARDSYRKHKKVCCVPILSSRKQ